MRVRPGVPHHRRKMKTRKAAKGMRGGRSKLHRTAMGAVDKSLTYAYRDRRNRKREFRRLWITRISAAARSRGISYSAFIAGLAKSNIDLDRKQLAEMAVNDPAGFDEVVSLVKKNAS